MRIAILVAQATNRVIGRDGDLPWRLSNDLRNFKRLTMSHPIIMGRKTMDSIGRLLPGRQTIILTRDKTYAFDGAKIAHTWEDALKTAEQYESKRIKDAGTEDAGKEPKPAEAFIVGGAEIYALAIPHTHRIYMTEVDAVVEGDTFFPQLDREDWNVIAEERFPADDKNDHPHSFVTLERR